MNTDNRKQQGVETSRQEAGRKSTKNVEEERPPFELGLQRTIRRCRLGLPADLRTATGPGEESIPHGRNV